MPEEPQKKTRVDLIRAIQKEAEFWEASARQASFQAVKDGTKDSMGTAREMLARHEACVDLASRIINKVNSHWPLKD